MGSKAVTDGQARSLIASFAIDTPWGEITEDLQPFIELTPRERGARFAAFLRNGCRIEVEASANETIVSSISNIGMLVPWLHEKQTNAGVRGDLIYKELRETGMIKTFASSADLERIVEKGLVHFRKTYGGKKVFAWRSTVERGTHNLFAPYLMERSGQLVLDERWLGLVWRANDIGLRLSR